MVRSSAFRRFFAGIPAKAGTTNIGQFFPCAYNSHSPTPIIGNTALDPLFCRHDPCRPERS
jgi:hypothetical protein